MPIRNVCAAVLIGTFLGCEAGNARSPEVAPAVTSHADLTQRDVAWSFDRPLPGATPHDADLLARLEAEWARRTTNDEPRTRHLEANGSPTFTNRLFLESSPYLRQHAHNPVNWFPWGDEAFALAAALGRPVLLSVGYSTCHWCHVMEEESYEDEEIARFLNEHFVAIKVDREERPDIDAVYMEAVLRIAGRGGWPMNVWLTADREPFYAGTYYPARDGDRGVRAGFLTVLRRLSEAYATRRDEVTDQASRLAAEIRNSLSPAVAGDAVPGPDVLHAAVRHYREGYDRERGGLRGNQKFPSGLPVRFLLRHYRRTHDAESLDMAVTTLRRMAAGGMYDQIGGGFHRYAIDPEWRVPHFEKMLYDNALLVVAYLEAYQVTGDEDLAAVARDILRYLRRDMTSPDGAFYSATDADSVGPDGHREEGRFFTWTPDEMVDTLGRDRAERATAYFGVTVEGNLEGRSVPYLATPLTETADELGLSRDALRVELDESRALLYAARAARPAPLRDEKILTAWNGLAISAFARAALVFGDEEYAAAAATAADFVLDHLRVGGRLRRRFIDGQRSREGYLDDHAFLVAALLDLYEATGAPRWLEDAIAIDGVVEAEYEDGEGGGFFLTADATEDVLVRQKPTVDGAEPSGSSVHTLNLLRLHEFTTDDRYRQRAESALRAHAVILRRMPAAMAEMLSAVDFRSDVPKEIVIVVPEHRSEAEPFLAALRRVYLPNRILTVVRENDAAQARLVPLVEGKVARDGLTTAYVCERGICELPTTDPDEFALQVARIEPLPAGAVSR